MDISNISQFQASGNPVQLSLLQTAYGTSSSMSEALARINSVSNDTASGSDLSQYLNTYNQLSQLQLLSGSSSSSADKILTTLSDALGSASSSSTDISALTQTLNTSNQLALLQTTSFSNSSSSYDALTSSLSNLLEAAQNGSGGGYLSQYMSTYNKLALVQLLGDASSSNDNTLMAVLASIADAISTRSNSSTNISGALLNLYA